MRELQTTLPELGLLVGSRAVLGAGIGLLLADRLSRDQRRAIGWTLLSLGAATTLPLALEFADKLRAAKDRDKLGQGGEVAH